MRKARDESKARILIVDDSPDTLEVLGRNLAAQGYAVLTAPGVGEALRILEEKKVDIVITDLKMPRVSGLDLVRHVRENLNDTEVLMISGYASIENAVQAVKTGAENFLAKPFTDDELQAAVQAAFHKLHARRAAAGPAPRPALPGLIGQSPPMRKLLEQIERAALSDSPVLIRGEPGTGKELVARAIHYGGPRASFPFVSVVLAGIPEERVESELWGSGTCGGLIETAGGGTLYLDEVADASLAIQLKLLYLIEKKKRAPAVRLLVASNRDLRALVKQHVFREDLFYRLSSASLEIPSLRQRGDDLLLLARYFASRFASEAGKPAPRFSDRAVEALQGYSWPGNVRELASTMQRLVWLTGDGAIDISALPPSMRFSAARDWHVHRTLAEVEGEHIRQVLASVEGNQTRAAEILGIDRKTLGLKMKRLGV